ncbi:MAG: hypothetical protein ACXVLQ_17375 [Bacteriovorax sp.]
MKATVILLALTISFGSFASEKSACKAEAHAAAIEAYMAKNGGTMLFSQSKFKPRTEGNNIVHLIQIQDNERGSNDILAVTMDKFNCSVISIE